MDLDNNRDHYYLAGPMGNHVGMQVDADGDDQTDRELLTQVFDAFGVAVTPGLFATGRYAFRGQEGSATDDSPGLIEMGARSYDPQLGRFIQADSVPVASMTTQGLNRYIYGLNDPVNQSDPEGTFPLAGIAFIVGFIVGSIIASVVFGRPQSSLGFGLRALISYSLRPHVRNFGRHCKLDFILSSRRLAQLMLNGTLPAAMFAQALQNTFLGWLGVAFAGGLTLGFTISSLLYMIASNRDFESESFEPFYDYDYSEPKFVGLYHPRQMSIRLS